MLAIIMLSMGCTPQHAEVTEATWYAWVAANSSSIVSDDVLPFLELGSGDEEFPEGAPEALIYECSERGWNAARGTWDDGYLGPREGEGNPENIVGGSCSPDDSGCDAEALAAECEGVLGASFHTFLQSDGYYMVQQEITPWRTEALINGEGDLQLTIHNELPHGEDFRFHFSVDPDFQPVECTTGLDGEPAIQYVDGSDWVTRWSEDEEGHSIYYLNAGTYQINPSDSEDYWFMESDWLSGFGHAKFAGEEFNSVPGYYGNYDNDPAAHFMFANSRSDPDMESYGLAVDNLVRTATEDSETETGGEGEEGGETTTVYSWQNELAVVGSAEGFTHKIESNDWRPINSTNRGLDGWAELHSSWVRIKDTSDIREGGMVEGDFQIFYQALESNSRLLVKGSFKITELVEDRWAYPVLEPIKRDEYGTPFCGGESLGI